MYPVSDGFLRAVKSNTRKYYWTGTIVTRGGMTYEFGAKEIVKGSGYISRQCCGSTEIELGTVYAAEMGITLLSDIDRYTLEDAQVTLVFHLVLADDSVEDVPMGVFEVSEANRLAKCLELKAYDFMLRFDKSFNGFETVGTAYDFIALCCKRCKVEFANKRAEIDAMPNGGVTLSVYTENDIETCRDVLFYVAQVLGGFFIINREGKLELRKYGKDPVMKVEQRHRFSSSFSDFITRYTAVSSTNKQTKVKLISIQFASSEENHMQFFAQVVVDVAADPVERSAEASGTVVIPFPGGSGSGTGSGTGGSEVSVDVSLPVKWQEDGQAVCHVVFEFNNEEIVEHCPVETWHSGKHILSLYYPIEKIVANYTNIFNVYLWMEYGSGTVDVGDCIASVSGQAMAAGEAWDGKLEVEDYTTRFAIGGGLDVNGFRESLSMQMKETVNRGFEVYFAERAGISGFCRPVEMEGV